MAFVTNTVNHTCTYRIFVKLCLLGPLNLSLNIMNHEGEFMATYEWRQVAIHSIDSKMERQWQQALIKE